MNVLLECNVDRQYWKIEIGNKKIVIKLLVLSTEVEQIAKVIKRNYPKTSISHNDNKVFVYRIIIKA